MLTILNNITKMDVNAYIVYSANESIESKINTRHHLSVTLPLNAFVPDLC